MAKNIFIYFCFISYNKVIVLNPNDDWSWGWKGDLLRKF